MNESVENFTIQFEQDVKTINSNKQRFENLPESIRVIVFIEIANTVKLLMRQNPSFLEAKSVYSHSLIAKGLRDIQKTL
jgi:hypothetical protein